LVEIIIFFKNFKISYLILYIGDALENLTLYESIVVFYYRRKKELIVGVNNPVVIACQVLCQIPIVVYLAIQAFS